LNFSIVYDMLSIMEALHMSDDDWQDNEMKDDDWEDEQETIMDSMFDDADIEDQHLDFDDDDD